MDNKTWTKKDNKVEIEEVHTSSGLEYDINFNGGNDYYTVAKCWDYLLAEKLRDAVDEYMQNEYKVVGQEDSEMLEESAGKPIAENSSLRTFINYIVDAQLAVSSAEHFASNGGLASIGSEDEVCEKLDAIYDDLTEVKRIVGKAEIEAGI